MLAETFKDTIAAIDRLQARMNGIIDSIENEHNLIRSRASLSYGTMPNGDMVCAQDQANALELDVVGFKRVSTLSGRLFISQKLLGNLQRSKIRTGLLLLAYDIPELNDDIIFLVMSN